MIWSATALTSARRLPSVAASVSAWCGRRDEIE
ncbi:hypothetical protein GGI64_000810 [Rhizobium leguminosarum]|uniref:Uncharacterized protein n=1 Tax=Rhizobium leguminosarum TaxID=384 RepID=A0A7Z0DUV8_RHILE|nr:hypothetical protein [Rhizobium leguminosarum]